MNPDVDYLAAASWDDSMFERTQWLRRHAPVYWSERNQLWVLTKLADVTHVSMNHKTFCSGQGVRPGNPVKIGLIDEDEPRHTRLRGLINKGFTPRMVAKLEPALRRIVGHSIDHVIATGHADFVTDIAVPIPLLLIAEMIGIRAEDYGRFHRWSDDLIAADGNLTDPAVMMAAGTAFLEYSEYLQDIIEDRRTHPRDDLVSILVGAKDAGTIGDIDNAVPHAMGQEHQRLANDELVMMLVILLVAGNETTRNAISGGMQLLMEHPAVRDQLVSDPSGIPMVIEEMLRLVSPVRSFGRTATQDTMLRGVPIAAGQTVLMLYGSANRDEEAFDAPDTFRPDRDPDHVAFGIGTHFCLGANLARLEMKVAFEEILRRLPDMTFDGQGPVIKPAALVRSCVSMPVRFTPGRPEGVSRTDSPG